MSYAIDSRLHHCPTLDVIVAPNTIDVQAHAKSATFQRHFFIREPMGPTISENESTDTAVHKKEPTMTASPGQEQRLLSREHDSIHLSMNKSSSISLAR